MKNPIVLLAAAVLLAPAMRADHEDFVVVNATASPAYTQQKFANGVPKPESYVFLEGKYFSGTTHDGSISHMGIMDIAKVLAPNLAKQNYIPTKDTKGADLVLVVNWGTTVIDETGKKSDPNTSFQMTDASQAVSAYNGSLGSGSSPPPASGDSPNLGSGNQALGQLTFDLMQNQANATSALKYAEYNADLLGYTKTLRKEESAQWASADGLNSDAESHLSDLQEERYFVILVAYDYQKILHGGKTADGSPAPLWELRMNIRANGNNFVEALPAMSAVASNYFGKQSDDLMSAQTDVGRDGRVEIGPLKVLSVGK